MSKTVAIGIQNFRDMIEKKCFGEHGDIYNPWSILNFLDTGKLATYWANTSSNSLVGKLVRESDEEIKALLADNLKEMNIYMNQVALQTFSYFDAGTRPSETGQPENFYHGFVLGLLVELSGAYTVTSNRESGYGRYDVVIEPL